MDKHLQAFVIFDIPHGPARKSDEEREREREREREGERGGECVCIGNYDLVRWYGFLDSMKSPSLIDLRPATGCLFRRDQTPNR